MGKTYKYDPKEEDLEGVFKRSSSKPAPYAHHYADDVSWTGAEERLQSLNIGSCVMIKTQHVVNNYHGSLNSRPAIVYGLWRDNHEQIKKIEVLKFTGKAKKPYPDDLAIDDGKIARQFGNVTSGLLVTKEIVIIDANPRYFDMSRLNNAFNEVQWPAVLARRAYALMFSKLSRIEPELPSFKGLSREGMTFTDIPQEAIRSGIAAPDTNFGDFERIPSKLLSGEEITAIGRYAATYASKMLQSRNPRFTFDNPVHWDMSLPFEGYIKWRRAPQELACEAAPKGIQPQ